MAQHQPFIQDFLEGKPKVFTALYGTIFPNVLLYIQQHGGDKAAAEDVFHNALVHLYVKLKKDALHIQSFENYLFIVCRNLWRREMSKKRVTKLADATLVAETMEQSQFYIEQGQWDLYREKLLELSQNCREVLHKLLKGVSYAQLVKQLGYASETVARQRVFKCKSKLIALIKADKRYIRLRN